jgi:hypothetical protein
MYYATPLQASSTAASHADHLRIGADGIEVSGVGDETSTMLYEWRQLVWSGSPAGRNGTLVLAFLRSDGGEEEGEGETETDTDGPLPAAAGAKAMLQCYAFEIKDKFQLLEVRSLIEMLRAHELAVYVRRFSTAICPRGCHWFPSSWGVTLLPDGL